MKIIILAAGKGTRALPLTRNTPKPLLDIGHGVTLLEKQLENIKKSKVISEVVLVVGYLAEQIEAKIKIYNDNTLKISTVYNPFYEFSNNLISLWLSKNCMDEDFLVTNGDNIFEFDVFSELVKNNKEGIYLTISKKNEYKDGDMKAILSDGSFIAGVSKEVPNKKADCESVGLVLVKGNKYRELFKKYLEQLARDKNYIDKFWLEIFNSMIKDGILIKTFEINGAEKWREIDFHLDLNEAKKLMHIED